MTILETIPIFAQPGNYSNLTLISLIIAIISVFIGIMLDKDNCEIGSATCIITAAISAVIFIIGVILMITEPEIDTGRKQYIVRLDNDVNINEFYNKYKIVDHTKYTDVYTVEELEND